MFARVCRIGLIELEVKLISLQFSIYMHVLIPLSRRVCDILPAGARDT